MPLHPFVVAGLLGTALAAPAQPVVQPGDPFYLPPEAQAFAPKACASGATDQQRMQEILRAMFRARADGGMGLTYDNAHTRTVEEVWREGKANCLSMTAFYVMACRSVKLPSKYAQALNTNHWRKVGTLVRYERHVVALLSMPPISDLIADFVPDLRKRIGSYVVAILPENRFRALFYSNRATEALTDGDLEEARTQAQLSLEADPRSSVGLNILGVVLAASGDPVKAEATFRHAMELDPKDGAPLGNLEALLLEAGRTEEAARFRVLAEKVRRKDPFFHAYLAEEALGEGDLKEAEARVGVALRLLPGEADFHLLHARIKLAQGDLEAASRAISAARERSAPGDRERYDGKLAYINSLQSGRAEH